MEIINNSDFFQCFFSIHEAGDPEATFTVLNHILSQEESTFAGEPVTFELICNRYQEYCTIWDIEYEGVDPRWIKDKDKKMTPRDYLSRKKYLQKSVQKKNDRDIYLFGGLSQEHWTEENKLFVSEILKIRDDNRKKG